MPETLAFDLYGTLVDPLRIAQQLERSLGSAAQRTAELWRMKQLEYTFRLTAMQRYEDFERVTAKALDFALAIVGHELSADDRRQAMAAYDDLDLFPDVAEGLRQVHDAGYPMVVLSNGTPRMVRASVRSAGLESWFAEIDQRRRGADVQALASGLPVRGRAPGSGHRRDPVDLLQSFRRNRGDGGRDASCLAGSRRFRVRHAQSTPGHGREKPDRTGRPASGDVAAALEG